MLKPATIYSLEEIQRHTLRDITMLEKLIVRRVPLKVMVPAKFLRREDWRIPTLILAREFQTLANERPLDLIRIRDYQSRLRQHIVTHQLKSFEPYIWNAEALEYLAETNHNA